MNSRTIEIKVRLSQKEAGMLNEKVKKSGLSREAYLRQLINGLVPQRELYRIGNNLNQIARKAQMLNMVDVPQYRKAVREFEAAVKKITEAVILPRK